jgi:hypothetical protein
MRLFTKKACLFVLISLSHSAYASASNEPSNRDIAVIAVAIGRACAELKPDMNYSLQNMLIRPETGVTDELRKEIAEVDSNPASQDEISVIQRNTKGDAMAMKSMCPSYAPLATK